MLCANWMAAPGILQWEALSVALHRTCPSRVMRRVIMLDEKLERLRTHQKGIERYRRLLATRLSDLERAYIERRLSEEQAYVRASARDVSRPPLRTTTED